MVIWEGLKKSETKSNEDGKGCERAFWGPREGLEGLIGVCSRKGSIVICFFNYRAGFVILPKISFAYCSFGRYL